MARRQHVVSRSGQKRQMIWVGANVSDTTLVASGNAMLTSLNAAALALRPFTIVRTHLLISFGSDQNTATEKPFGQYGRIVVKETASAVGVTAIPTPGTETDADWFVWQGLCHSLQFTSGVGIQNPADNQYVVDSKAMRKVGTDDDLVSVVQLSAAFGAEIVVRGRYLIKLH